MKKTHNQYAAWIDVMRRARTFGCLGSWLIWGCVALILLGFFIFTKLR